MFSQTQEELPYEHWTLIHAVGGLIYKIIGPYQISISISSPSISINLKPLI